MSREMKEDRKLTMVVSVTEPKLLMKMLQVTFTGGPARRRTGMNPKPRPQTKNHNLTTEY